ncbi:MAG: hypothetical protein QXO75_09885, partial [Nitrososphaerota archaeon]
MRIVPFIVIVVILMGSFAGLMTFSPVNGFSSLNTMELTESSATKYNVSFVENGLPSGISWGVVVNNTTYLTDGNILVTYFANGTFNYTVEVLNQSYRPVAASGAFLVSGHPLQIPVSFEAVLYPVLFNEKGLPVGLTWSVSLGNRTLSTTTGNNGTGDYLIFYVINGTYTWKIPIVGGYIASPENGTVKVNGNFNVFNIYFVQIYSQVVFIAYGLPVNASWFVIFNGSIKYSTYPDIIFISKFGNFSYEVGTNSTSYHVNPSKGFVVVNSFDVYVRLHFWSRNYTVEFVEKGLPLGDKWSVSAGPYSNTSTSSNLDLSIPNGTYPYSVVSFNKTYEPVNSTGLLVINGSSVVVNVVFKRIIYSVIFYRSGPPVLPWAVAMTGEQIRSNNSTIIFHEPPGNYTYTVTIFNKNYSVVNQEGIVFVTNNMNVSVIITPVTYEIEFLENGLSSSQTWSVTLGNNTVSGTGDSILFSEMNGTYPYSVNKEYGYSIFPQFGIVTVDGSNVT